MPIPNAERAVVDIRKLRDYCLNPMHDEGQHKARLFVAALGITADDAEDLRVLLLQAVKTSDAQFRVIQFSNSTPMRARACAGWAANRRQAGVYK